MESKRGIRTVLVIFSVAIVLVMGIIFLLNAWNMEKGSERELLSLSSNLMDSVYSGIYFPMSIGDSEAIRAQLSSLGTKSKNLEVIITDFEGKVSYGSVPGIEGKGFGELSNSEGLLGALNAALTGTTQVFRGFRESSGGKRLFSTIRPIPNEPSCYHCHGRNRKVLGSLILRLDETESHEALIKGVSYNVFLGVIAGLAFLVLILFLIRSNVVGPVKELCLDLEGLADKVSTNTLSAKDAASVIAQESSNQASALEEISASTDEISTLGKRNSSLSSEMQAPMEEVILHIEGVNQKIQELGRAMEKSRQAGQDAAKILKNIDEIAFQTNLLALNAAVEAARAGEAGEGFGVVASEVRNLALRSQEASKATHRLLDEIVSGLKEVAEALERTQSSYKDVIRKVEEGFKLSNSVSEGGNQQVAGLEQIRKGLAELDSSVQHHAAKAQEMAALGENLGASVEGLLNCINRLKSLVG